MKQQPFCSRSTSGLWWLTLTWRQRLSLQPLLPSVSGSSFSFPDSWTSYVSSSMMMKGPSFALVSPKSEEARSEWFQFILVVVGSSLLLKPYTHLPFPTACPVDFRFQHQRRTGEHNSLTQTVRPLLLEEEV